MNVKKIFHRAQRRFWLLVIVGFIIITIIIALVIAVWSYHELYIGKIFPGVYVGSINVGGFTPQEAQEQIQRAWDEFQQKGVVVQHGDRQIVLTGVVRSSFSPDLTYELVHAEIDQAQQAAYNIGRRGSLVNSYLEPLIVRFTKIKIPLKNEVILEGVLKYIYDSIPEITDPARDATIQVDKDGLLSITPERVGYIINTTSLQYDLTTRFNKFSNEPIVLQLTTSHPLVTKKDLSELIERAQFWLRATGQLGFTFENEVWLVKYSEWYSWIAVERQGATNALVLSSERAEAFFANIRKKLDQSAINATFEITEGKVVKFQPSQLGRQIDILATLTTVQALLDNGELQSVPLVVAITEPEISTAQANEYGISELIGVGRSNFSGSPKNRRLNIKAGAQKLHGVIIKPDEEFSLIATLGPIDGEHGFLPELVIKGDKTIPEFGGGLCQIGTTTFRAALASGLPITERRNHSYRVPYYEPAGTDATIYDPKPDFRFKNDTGSVILIQTNIQGDEAIFEFWGKRDGRVAVSTKPKIFNVVNPLPTKLIETEDLKPGEKKCTEKPHVGVDAEFTYSVTYPDGQKQERVFKSHYVPWQEVCLVGVPKGTLNEILNPES